MRRRDFITLLGSAAATWPLVARAQQQTMPVIGFLSFGSPESNAVRLTGLRRGLHESGYVEGRDFVLEYRDWAGNQADRLPAMAAELVHIPATVIVTIGVFATLAVKIPQPLASQSCSALPLTPCSSGLLLVSIDREATLRAPTPCLVNSGPRDSRCCTSWCPALRRSVFLRIRTIRYPS